MSVLTAGCGVDFLRPCTQAQGREPCPQGHGPHNSVHTCSGMEKHVAVFVTSAPQPSQADLLLVLLFLWLFEVAFLCGPQGESSCGHERPRWGLLCVAEETATAAFDASARTADRRRGAALHHSRDVGPGKNDGLRAQTTASSGSALVSRRRQRRRWWQSRSVTWLSRGRSSPHRCWRTLRLTQWTRTVQFLLQAALLLKEEEAQERRREWEEEARVASRVPMLRTLHGARPPSSSSKIQEEEEEEDEASSLWYSQSSTAGIALLVLLVVIPSCCVPLDRRLAPGARHPRRYGPEGQYCRRDSGSGICMAGFAGVAPRAVFFYVVVRPKMLRNMASTHQKDSYAVGWVSACHDAPRAVFLLLVVRPKMLGTMAGTHQKDSCVAWCLWFRLQKLDFPQLQFTIGRRFSCRGAEVPRPIPMVLLFS